MRVRHRKAGLPAPMGRSVPCAGLLLAFSVVPPLPLAHACGQELEPIGRARISAVYDLDARPPYAYALERENLRVLDIRDPTHVREVANLEFEGERLRSIIFGSGLYMVGWDQPLAVVDISAPRKPRWVGEHPDVRETERMLIVGNHLFVAGGAGNREAGSHTLTLHVLALTETASVPTRVATLTVAHDAALRLAGLAYDAGRLFLVLQQTALRPSELVVVDVGDPSTPRITRRIALPEGLVYQGGFVVRGTLGYSSTRDADGRYGLTILDLGGRRGATTLGSVTDDRLRAGTGLRLHRNVMYASFKGQAILATFDVSDPEHPRLASAFVPEGWGWGVAGLGFSFAGDRLYLSGDAGPSAIFDVSSALQPRYLGRWDYQEGGWARGVALRGRVAAVLNWGAGLLIYDAAEPSSLTRLGVYRSSGHPLDRVAEYGDRILLSHGPRASELVDVSDPSAPKLVRRFDVPEAVAGAVLTATHVIEAYASGALGIVDLADLAHPISYLALDGPATDIAVHQDRAVVAHRDGGVSAIDIGIPEKPGLLGRAEGFEPEDERDLEMVTRLALSDDGARAFTVRGEVESTSTLTLTVYDLPRDSTPRRLGQLDVPLGQGPAAEDFPILAARKEVLVGAGSDLVRIDVSDPGHPIVSSRFHLKMSMSANGVARRAQYLFVAAAEDGLKAFRLPNSW